MNDVRDQALDCSLDNGKLVMNVHTPGFKRQLLRKPFHQKGAHGLSASFYSDPGDEIEKGFVVLKNKENSYFTASLFNTAVN